jgi:phage gp29-like protein
MATAIKKETAKELVIENYITARPVRRTSYDIADWRRALTHAEATNGTRVDLYDLYEDVLLDPHLSSQLQKRVSNITNTPWYFYTNKKVVEALNTLTESPQFEQVLTEILNTLFYGKTVMELGKKKVVEYGKEVYKLHSYCIKRQHIRAKEKRIVREQYNSAGAVDSTSSISYIDPMYAPYVCDLGSDTDLGLLLKAVPYVLLKRGDVADWAQFVQLFGMPFREYRYNGYDEGTMEILKKNAEEMGAAPYMILPDGTTMVIHDNKISGTGAGDVYEKLARFCDEQISILILGNTETTNSSKSSGYAQSETHMKTQLEVYRDDIKYVKNWLNDTVKPVLYNIGYAVADGIFNAHQELNLEEITKKLAIVEQVKRIGEPIDTDYVYETSGIPKPSDYDAQKAAQEAEKVAQQRVIPNAKKEKKLNLNDSLDLTEDEKSFFDKIRSRIADFFDPAQ